MQLRRTSLRHVLPLVLILSVAWSACGNKKEGNEKASTRGAPKAGSAEAAFVDMQAKLRAADAQGLWSMFSSDMQEGMSMKMGILLERPEDVVAREFGASKSELKSGGMIGVYGRLLASKAMKAKLALGMPKVTSVTESGGETRIHYTDAGPNAKTCWQPFVREDDLWKVARAPVCR